MIKLDTTFILIYSKDLPDVAAFLEMFNFFFKREYPEQGIGQKSATFKLNIKGDEIEIKEDLKQQEIKNMLIKIANLEEECNALKDELAPYKSKQDLSINQELKAKIFKYRSKKLSYQKIADKLNKKGYKSSRGNSIGVMQVSRLLKKYKEENQLE